MENPNDELIKGCIKQDRRSQELLYNTFSKKMYQVCLSYTKNRDEAKDVLQDGFIKVFKSINTFKGEVDLERWIRRIIVNTSIDYYRKSLKELKPIDISEVTNLASELNYLETIGANDLLGLVRKLPDGARVIFNLYAVEGYTHKEISEMINISEGTSKSQFSRGKQLLQKMIMDLNKQKTIVELN
jgi:RNA polymerase sigma-70 factor (ECF subfamily)